MFPTAADRKDADNFRAYFKQAREELSLRLLERLYYSDGTKNKWWQVSTITYSIHNLIL